MHLGTVFITFVPILVIYKTPIRTLIISTRKNITQSYCYLVLMTSYLHLLSYFEDNTDVAHVS